MNVLDCFEKSGIIYFSGSHNLRTKIKTKRKNICKIGFRPEKIRLSDPKKSLFTGQIIYSEYHGSEQFIYIDVGARDNFIILREKPDLKVTLNKKVGLTVFDKDLYFFSEDGSSLEN